MGRGRKKVVFSKRLLMSMHDLTNDEYRLYTIVCCYTNSGGVCDDPYFVARGLRKDEAIVDSLIEKGYIIHVGDEYFVRHFWLSNNHRKEFADSLTCTNAWQRGIIRFEGDEFNSALTVNAHSMRTNCAPTAESTSTNCASTQRNTAQRQHMPNINANAECTVNAESFGSGSPPANGGYPNDGHSDGCAPAITASDAMFINTQMARLKSLGYDEASTRQWLERTITTEGRDVAGAKVDRLVTSGRQVNLSTGEMMA